ncbi:ATP-grasp domain-containing protein [Actinomycetospora endophytica]|uniref:acetyl-CoA carboxylase n=1 Tax=Actinomycetospora endophytica TaxID=2291215 RepID=A0ABS8PEM3_9PSEU|nr:carboxyl transferase domain-containing protein [Actinomycetospora endophytica]MCD2195950.1 ATP-grasp domain-containing protein [Actinomycetospora endophytica]
MHRLLVANRGEIALRLLEGAAALGWSTVVVHPADERDSPAVARADDAVELPGAGPAAYLDVEAVVTAAVDAGADALHPGYGFLSENPALARACADAGISFVGPSPETLELFGDKARARDHAAALDVAVLEATGPDDAADLLARTGAVMVKAVAGGGGRGMRVVRDAAALLDALARAASEAGSAFGDRRVFVEQYLDGARHVEVQLVGDGTGEVAVLADRDCSLQRRHQKLVEIAPAPDLPDDVRRRLHSQARSLGESVALRGLATAEFLVAGDRIAFLEVNPRLQVEHTVTEEVLGVDLVVAGLRIAEGATLAELGLGPVGAPRGVALQARVCTEILDAVGSVRPAAGTLTRFTPPSGRGVRVDTHGGVGLVISPRYDSLLAKVVVHDADLAGAVDHAARALAAFDVAGVATQLPVLRALLGRDEVRTGRWDTGLVERLLPELVVPDDGGGHDGGSHAGSDGSAARGGSGRSTGTRAPLVPEEGEVALRAATAGTVVAVEVPAGATLTAGAPVVVVEAMKMEHVAAGPVAGTVRAVSVAVGDVVAEGDVLAVVTPDESAADTSDEAAAIDPDHVRPDLAEIHDRHRFLTDDARPDAVAKRRALDRRTARENVEDLCDPGTFVEYGGLAVAAQRQRRSMDDLIARTPADGIVTGIGAVDGRRCVVLAYDYTVLAGTQGVLSHAKTDRALELALAHDLPVVLFAEGGGGRPGETDTIAVAQLDVPTFALFARLSGRVPTVAVVAGYCFAGNAALAGCADLVVAVEGANLGMGGPAMIAGGGLGEVAPGDVGAMDVQVPNGVVDVLVPDEAAAVDVARRYLALSGPATEVERPDQRTLRHAVPENRLRVYDVRAVIDTLVDAGSLTELRPRHGVGMITAFARIEGRAIGVLANDPRHLGGAIDAEGAEKAARFLQLCDFRGMPVVSLCDTPGFMVGPDAEATATVRRFSRMFVAGANLRVPVVCVVLRKAYGLGAMAMAGGSMRVPVTTVAWPSGEFGGMGLEGAVELGYQKELAALDGDARRARYDELVAALYEQGKALSAAVVFEIDDVIDPADTAAVVVAALETADGPLAPRRAFVDTR